MNRTVVISTVLALCLSQLFSCGPAGEKSSSKPPVRRAELTLDQMDSLGRIFKPAIGKYGGVLRRALGADPDGFCPALASSGYSMDVIGPVYEGLITDDPVTLDYKPWIAKSWEVSPDGLVWTFHLRNDVCFSDGVKLTAYDVVFTFNDVIYNRKIRSPLRDNFSINGKPIRVSAPDSFTVRFDLPAPFAPFLTVAGMSIMPRHVYAKPAADGTLETFTSTSADPRQIVGSGPFMLEKYELGQRVVLTRNPHYWRFDSAGNREPYLDKLLWLIIKEPNSQMLRFQLGEIDHLVLMPEHFPMLKPQEREKDFSIYRVGPRWYDPFFVFNENNQKNPKTGKFYLDEKKQRWFRNKNFRKACAHAVNYRAIIDIVYNGMGYPPAGIWGAHKGFFHDPKAATYDFDTVKARQLLAAEGFRDRNGDGWVEDTLGNTVEFTIMTGSGVQMIQKMYEMVAKDLKNIGLKVHLNLVEFNTMIDKTMNTYDWDVVAYSLGGIRDPHFGKDTQIWSSFRYVINPNQKSPSYPWEKRIADIFDLAVTEMDRNKRKALYDEWQEIVMDQCTHVYMPLREVIIGAGNKFGNVHFTRYLAQGENLFYNIEELYVK